VKHTTIRAIQYLVEGRSIRSTERLPGLMVIPSCDGNPTLDKIRRVMSPVFKPGQRYGLTPRSEESNPLRFVRCKTTSNYEAMILTPHQAFLVLVQLEEPERT
jgi:hypothetical protein